MTENAAPTVAHVEFLSDGLTLGPEVWRAGAVGEFREPKQVALLQMDLQAQYDKWGRPMFRLISEEEYLALKDSKTPRVQGGYERPRYIPPQAQRPVQSEGSVGAEPILAAETVAADRTLQVPADPPKVAKKAAPKKKAAAVPLEAPPAPEEPEVDDAEEIDAESQEEALEPVVGGSVLNAPEITAAVDPQQALVPTPGLTQTAPVVAQATAGEAPWPDYADLSTSQTMERLAQMDSAALTTFLAYESTHRNRPGILAAVESGLGS